MNYMYSNMQQQMVRPAYPSSGLYSNRIRPVSSLEEARASVIDFDGSVFYFPDAANKKIYTKQINLDGTSLLNMYVLQEIPTTPQPEQLADTYVSKDEFQQTISLLLGEINKMKGEQNNNDRKPTEPNDANVSEFKF